MSNFFWVKKLQLDFSYFVGEYIQLEWKAFQHFPSVTRGTPYYQRSGGKRRRYESQWDYVALNPEGMKKKPQISHLQIICLTVQKLTENMCNK